MEMIAKYEIKRTQKKGEERVENNEKGEERVGKNWRPPLEQIEKINNEGIQSQGLGEKIESIGQANN